MSSAATILLVRHAAHDRVDRILCGRMPEVRLGPAGHAQAAEIGRRLAAEPVAAIYASPLERARETASPLAARLGLPVAPAEGLNEIDMGEWTGAAFSDLDADPRWHAWNGARAAGMAPGGEAMAAVQARVLACLEAWRTAHPGACVVAVSHSDVIKAAICGVLGLSLDRYHAFEIEPASTSTLVLWPGGGKVVRLNAPVGACP